MNITVFLGSRPGNIPEIQDRLKELAAWIGQGGHTLIYGGSEIGLMGILAHTVKENGGRVVGIEPQFFVDMGLVYEDSDELIVTKGMSDRKEILLDRADAVIVFPGGSGTLEEFGQAASVLNLEMDDYKCIVYNAGGFYDHLEKQLDVMAESGFYDQNKRSQIIFANSLEEIKKYLS